MGPDLGLERDRIAKMLTQAGLVATRDLENALSEHAKTGERVVNILMSQGALDSREFARFLAESPQLDDYDRQDFDIAAGIIELVPRNFALMNNVIPICLNGTQLTLATARPLDPAVTEALQEHTGLTIKPLICSEDDVRSSLQRYYEDRQCSTSLEGPLKLTTAVTLLHQIDSLPALPGTVNKVREILHDDEGSAADVGDIIAQDPAIAAMVLKVANSAAYGFSHQVDGLQLAVSLLGLVETYSVVVSSAVLNVFDRSRTFDYVNFWLESTACASLAKALLPALGMKNRAGIFTAGLLHDIGRIALVQIAPKHYQQVDPALAGKQLVAAEERILGLSHPEAGVHLADYWELPEELAECIQFHHAPHYAGEEHRPIVSLINVADVASRAHREEIESCEIDFTECALSLEFLNLSEEQVREVFNSVEKPSPADSLW